jgi:tRNA (cytidine/uridine-2'-O-)-methyltransferase
LFFIQIHYLERFYLLPRSSAGTLESASLLDFASSQIQKSMENSCKKCKFSRGQNPYSSHLSYAADEQWTIIGDEKWKLMLVINIVLYQPEIPPNTGNIIRLCANTGARLHLVEPMGFVLDDARLRRAGLDYREMVDVSRYVNWDRFMQANPGMRLWAVSTRGETRYDQVEFRENDGLLFGPETSGLPDNILEQVGQGHVLRLPMHQSSRSLNLSNTVAIALYEALRQQDFGTLN